MLTDHRFEPDYASEDGGILSEFYLPALGESVQYDRITGFFASTVFTIAWPALRQFVQSNNGRMRILCSPRLADHDAEGLVSGYQARTRRELEDQLRIELDDLLARPHLNKHALMLACLIATGALEVRLATVSETAEAKSRRMMHDKVGVFSDGHGHSVGFRGTFNETYLGLSDKGNIESVDVWTSWEGGKDVDRLNDAVARFDRIWSGQTPGIEVTELPDATIEQLRSLAATVDSDELLAELERGAPEADVSLRRSLQTGAIAHNP